MAEDRGPHSLDACVRRYLAELGLWGYHTRNSVGSAPGWPDWVIVGTKIIYRELKTEHGKLTTEQRAVGYRLMAAGASWAVWRPSDLISGEVLRQLRELV